MLFCLVLLLQPIFPTKAAWIPEVDYMARMMSAAISGDMATGAEAQRCRDAKIAAMGLQWNSVSFEELFLLARLIYTEAGSQWLGLFWKMAVGEVALNRVASPEFPNTLAAVIAQPGQYASSRGRLPDYASVLAAKNLLEGQRVLWNPAVVFQANVPQGSGIFAILRDPYLGNTYLCLSSHPELY